MDEFRLCKQCHFVKPLEYFYVSNQTKCKECVKAAVRANRAEKIEYYRAYDRERGNEQKRIDLSQRITSDWRKKNPERWKAHIDLNNAVRVGKVKKSPCWVCGDKAQAHHPDYSSPLDVVWLCAAHHKAAHAAAA
jgi:hypothetical protein